MLERMAQGESPEEIALDKAKWVYTFTNLQPFKLIHFMTGLTLRRSQAVDGKEDLFNIP
jgi:hypothetical protein